MKLSFVLYYRVKCERGSSLFTPALNNPTWYNFTILKNDILFLFTSDSLLLILSDAFEETIFYGKKMIRSMLSVISGYISFYVAVLILWLAFGYSPDQDFQSSDLLIISICLEALFAIGCGYLVALIANRLEILHAAILSALFVISGIAYLLLRLNHCPIWVPLSTIFVNAPCIILGGFIRRKQVRIRGFGA